MNLQEAKVLVTGGSSGIGLETARLLIAKGARVAICGRRNVRVMLVNPSEVQTNFVANSGREARPFNESKLQSVDIAHVIASLLELNDVGFVTETTVWATNPQ